MKFKLFISGLAVLAGLFIVLNPLRVSAKSDAAYVEQAHVSTLVTMAVPPYKW